MISMGVVGAMYKAGGAKATYIAYGSRWGGVKILRVIDGVKTILSVPINPFNVTKVKFSPAGKYLAVCSNSAPYLSIFEISGAVVTRLDLPSVANNVSCGSVAWHPDGERVLILQGNNNPNPLLRVKNSVITVVTDKTLLTPASGTPYEACFSATGDKLAHSLSSGGAFSTHNNGTFTYIPSTGLTDVVMAMTSGMVNGVDTLITVEYGMSGSVTQIQLMHGGARYNANTGSSALGYTKSIALSPDGKYFLGATYGGVNLFRYTAPNTFAILGTLGGQYGAFGTAGVVFSKTDDSLLMVNKDGAEAARIVTFENGSISLLYNIIDDWDGAERTCCDWAVF